MQGLIDPNLVHVLYGFSKVSHISIKEFHKSRLRWILYQDFASGGLHLGFLVTANEQLRKACKMVM